MQYEYSIMVFGDNVDFSAPDTGEAFAIAIGGLVKPLSNGLASAKGGEWEVVSHDILLVGQSVIGSFLVRRPEPSSKSR